MSQLRGILCLLILIGTLPWLQANYTGCDGDQFHDHRLRRCRHCSEVCHPLQDTMRECRIKCPDTYCPIVCEQSNKLMTHCFTEVCKDFADKNVSCVVNKSDTLRSDSSPSCGPGWTTYTYVFAAFGALLLVGIIYIIGYCQAKRKYSGRSQTELNPKVTEEKSHKASKDALLMSPTSPLVHVTSSVPPATPWVPPPAPRVTPTTTALPTATHYDGPGPSDMENQTLLKVSLDDEL